MQQIKMLGGNLSRQVVFRYDVSLLKPQTEVWISIKSMDLNEIHEFKSAYLMDYKFVDLT